MEQFIEKLDQLIALKKNKGHKITKSERSEFASAWSELIAADEGLSERAEQYFYEGFIFTGAQPFVKWVLSSEDKFLALDSLLNGRIYGKDTSSSFRVLVSVLAQLIKANDSEINLICPLIKRIPSASKNKEKKTIGDGHRVLLKYFIGELDSTTVFPVLFDLNIKHTAIESFVSVFDELLSRIDASSLSGKDAKVLASVNRWLHPDESVEKSAKPAYEPDRSVKEDHHKMASENANAQNQNAPSSSGNPYDRLLSVLNEAISLSGTLHNASKSTKQQCEALQKSVGILQQRVDSQTALLNAARQREVNLEEQLADRGNQISMLNSKAKALEDKIQELNSLMEAKEQEIEQRTQMIEALSRDRAKQSDEHLHRLASKLKVEYRDFRDAESLEMNCDLGENMREQLKNVFSILIKAGITLD